jgi:hypothetical protein
LPCIWFCQCHLWLTARTSRVRNLYQYAPHLASLM